MWVNVGDHPTTNCFARLLTVRPLSNFRPIKAGSLLLDQCHRSDIVLPCTDYIINHSRHDDKHENHNGPIHIRRRWQWSDGEKAHDESDGQERQSGIIDRSPKLAERPPSRKKGFIAETLEADAADGCHVREDKGSV